MSLIGCKQLMEITGYQRPADVARCLREQGVHVFEGRCGPWTTIELINLAGGLDGGERPDEALRAESII